MRTKKEPRYYQLDAVKAIIASWRNGNVPCASISTGGGKSLIAAMLAEQALKQNKRVIIFVPTMELCQQNFKELAEYTDYPMALGVCCSKLQKFQTQKQAVIATYTSFLRRRTKSGAFDLMITDESHLISSDPDSSYQKIIRSLKRLNPNMLMCGLTATPYRQHGMLTEDSIKGKATFNHLCYQSDISKLIREGYLSHVESISGDIEIDLTQVGIKGGDYDTQKMGVKFDEICADAVADMRLKFVAYNISTAIIFASTVANARKILEEWGDNTTMRLVYGEMSEHDRKETIKWIKDSSHEKRYIVNVGVLTTGFDHSALDCVVLMRATRSLGLYIQMAGRVIRAHADKETGFIIDYGSNIDRHGSIDSTILPKTKKKEGDAPVKYCHLCGVENRAAAKKCSGCEAEFISLDDRGLYQMRSKAEVLALKERSGWQTFEVGKISWSIKKSVKTGKPMLQAHFFPPEDDFGFDLVSFHNQLYCIEHDGIAKIIAERFFINLFKDVNDFYECKREGFTCENMLILLENNYNDLFKRIDTITIGAQKDNKKYMEIKGTPIFREITK